MRKVGASVVVFGMLLGGVAAHAAPVQPGGPAEAPRAVPGPGPALTIRKVEAVVVPVPSKCGEPAKLRVALRNKTLQPWSGNINFVSTGNVNTPVHLAASGEDATKTIDVSGGILDCKKPLGSQVVRVWKEPTSPILAQSLKPKRVFSLRDLSANAPPSSNTKPWLRRVVVDANCGEKVSPLVVVHTFGPAQEAKLKLEFGATSKAIIMPLAANQATQVPLVVPGTLDCQAEGGIPGFGYELYGANPARGILEPNEVTFE